METPRGWRIAKEKQAHKIDVVVALAMAVLGAVQGGIAHRPLRVPRSLIDRLAAESRVPAIFFHNPWPFGM